MGAPNSGGARQPRSGERGRLALLVLGTTAALLVLAAPAQATFHLILIREVHPGSLAQPQSSYVELQMYADGQSFVGGEAVTLYDASGASIGTFTFASDLPGGGASQQTILLGDSGVQSAFGVAPDLVASALDIPAAGGAVCWAGSIDCVAWGSFAGSAPSPTGTPVDASGIPDDMAIARKISGGTCSNLLDGGDDTNDSASDFADAAPSPLSYATVPAATSCISPPAPPTAVIDTKPPNPTSSTSAAFSFHSSPAGAALECRLDSEPFADCDSGSTTYPGPLSEASHTFQVRASNANGSGAPAGYTWTVDHTAPTASITSHPADPSPGGSASFRYASNEAGSKFECRLKPLEASFGACNTQPKVYTGLADGEHEFEVKAVDAAGNAQASPTLFAWTVDNSLADTTPPDTSIVSRPPDPSGSSTATFTYVSSEPGSTFECKLDAGQFAACSSSGATYAGLGQGQHSFQVRASDASDNVDPTPAGYTFGVVLPVISVSPTSSAAPSPIVAPPTPQTTLSARPAARTRDRTPTFRFRSSAGATFQCKLDGGPFKPCRSPFTTKQLSLGRHTLKVRALLAGVRDPTPATYAFRVVRAR